MSSCDSCGQPIETTGESRSHCVPCKTLSKRRNSIQITPMETGDLELVLAWRSNPKIYRHFRKQDSPLDWESHLSWYESRAAERHDFIIHYEGRRVGVVSLTESEEISIYLADFSARGNGVATAALKWICDRFEYRLPLVAEIHKGNAASKRLFENCGFQQCGRDEEWEKYYYEL